MRNKFIKNNIILCFECHCDIQKAPENFGGWQKMGLMGKQWPRDVTLNERFMVKESNKTWYMHPTKIKFEERR